MFCGKPISYKHLFIISGLFIVGVKKRNNSEQKLFRFMILKLFIDYCTLSNIGCALIFEKYRLIKIESYILIFPAYPAMALSAKFVDRN